MARHPRDDSISMSVGGEDKSPVKFIQPIHDRMYAVKEEGIWHIQLADQIDPERHHSQVPNTQQRISSRGTKCPAILRTLIQAIELTRSNRFKDDVNLDDVRSASLVCATAMALLEENIARMAEDEKRVSETLANSTTMKNFSLPHYPELELTWASSMHAINLGRSAIRDIAFTFFPENAAGKEWMNDLRTKISFDATRDFNNQEAWDSVDYNMKLIRNIRNCEQHPKANRSVKISDYWMMEDGNIAPPIVKICGLSDTEIITSLRDFIEQIKDATVFSFEMILLWCAGTKAERCLGHHPFFIEKTRNYIAEQTCRFALAVEHEGRLMVLG